MQSVLLCCLLQDLGGYVEDSSRVADHAHKFTTNIERVSPQLYYGVVITEIKVGNISVPLDCTEVSVFYTHAHTHARTHTHTVLISVPNQFVSPTLTLGIPLAQGVGKAQTSLC